MFVNSYEFFKKISIPGKDQRVWLKNVRTVIFYYIPPAINLLKFGNCKLWGESPAVSIIASEVAWYEPLERGYPKRKSLLILAETGLQ